MLNRPAWIGIALFAGFCAGFWTRNEQAIAPQAPADVTPVPTRKPEAVRPAPTKRPPEQGALKKETAALKAELAAIKSDIRAEQGLPIPERLWEEWRHRRLGEGQVLQRASAPRGGSFTHENLGNGIQAEREYAGDGTIRNERLQFRDIEPVVRREFYPNQTVKELNFHTADGTKDTTQFDSDGIPTTRTIEYVNGDKVEYDYDRSGTPRRRTGKE